MGRELRLEGGRGEGKWRNGEAAEGGEHKEEETDGKRMKMEVVGWKEERYKGGEWHKGAEMDNYWMRGRRVRRRGGGGDLDLT